MEHTLAVGGRLSLIPSVDVGATNYNQGAFDESNGDDYQLGVGEFEGVIYSINPAIELRSAFGFNGKQGSVGLSAGVLALTGDTRRTTAVQYAASTAGGPTFTLVDEADTTFVELGASVHAQLGNNLTLRAEFNTLQSSNRQNYIGSIKLNYFF